MEIEHVAFNVPDPVAFAEWYVRNLGMTIVRNIPVSPHTHFLADSAGRTVVEVYRHPSAPVPDYGAMEPLVLHLAFVVGDIEGERARLIRAGASAAGEINATAAGDRLVFLRDPWGFAIQLVTRAVPMLK